MQKAAEEKQVVFLDLYSEFANENGELPEEASKDGGASEERLLQAVAGVSESPYCGLRNTLSGGN